MVPFCLQTMVSWRYLNFCISASVNFWQLFRVTSFEYTGVALVWMGVACDMFDTCFALFLCTSTTIDTTQQYCTFPLRCMATTGRIFCNCRITNDWVLIYTTSKEKKDWAFKKYKLYFKTKFMKSFYKLVVTVWPQTYQTLIFALADRSALRTALPVCTKPGTTTCAGSGFQQVLNHLILCLLNYGANAWMMHGWQIHVDVSKAIILSYTVWRYFCDIKVRGTTACVCWSYTSSLRMPLDLYWAECKFIIFYVFLYSLSSMYFWIHLPLASI